MCVSVVANSQRCDVSSTDRIAAGLTDDDPVGEGLVVGLDVKCPLLSVQGVFLDEVDIVHTCNLQTTNTHTRYKKLNLHERPK